MTPRITTATLSESDACGELRNCDQTFACCGSGCVVVAIVCHGRAAVTSKLTRKGQQLHRINMAGTLPANMEERLEESRQTYKLNVGYDVVNSQMEQFVRRGQFCVSLSHVTTRSCSIGYIGIALSGPRGLHYRCGLYKLSAVHVDRYAGLPQLPTGFVELVKKYNPHITELELSR